MTETRKLAAILVADVVGYSRLAGADEDRALARLRAVRSDLIDPIIAVHHGRVVKRTGDGAIVEFRSVVDAVRCAIEVQHGMIERNAGVPAERRIEFRIGIHLGDVVEESDGDLMGDGVNIAARLEGIAQPGAICLSEQAYWQVKGRLDLAVSDLGPTQLKNIADPIRVYSLEVGQPAQAKPSTEAKVPAKPYDTKRHSRLALLGAAIAALIVIAVGAWWFLDANRSATVPNARTPVASNAPPPLAAQRLSVVVLPFANLSGDTAQDYLEDALTDGLTTALSRIHDSFVIARNTAFTYKGKSVDAKEIGKELGVRYVLEGSVQPSGNQVRVNAQLIDADSGAYLWADQFDTPRADLLQMQDEIVTRLAHAMDIQLSEAEATRLKRTRVANPDAEDLAIQCDIALTNAGWFGKQADAAYPLCERALAIDPNNVHALIMLSLKFWIPILRASSADPKTGIKRADELVSKALALDPNYPYAHNVKAWIFTLQGRHDEAIAENERALALDPTFLYALGDLGWNYMNVGQFEKTLESSDKAIRLSPHDPSLEDFYLQRAAANFGLKQYDRTIEAARRAIAINPNDDSPHYNLIPALALAGHEAEAHKALQNYLASVPDGPKTIAAWKARNASFAGPDSPTRVLELNDRHYEGLRKAGMPEE